MWDFLHALKGPSAKECGQNMQLPFRSLLGRKPSTSINRQLSAMLSISTMSLRKLSHTQSKVGLPLLLFRTWNTFMSNDLTGIQLSDYMPGLCTLAHSFFFVGDTVLLFSAFLITKRVPSKYIRFLKLWSIGERGMNPEPNK